MHRRKCKSCGNFIDSGLIICPFCHSSPYKEKTEEQNQKQIADISRIIWRNIQKKIIAWLGILSLIFGIGLFQAYNKATDELQSLLIKQISKEFSQPTIQNTVKKVASDEAQQILTKEVQPEVDNFKLETESKLKYIEKIIFDANSQLEDLTNIIELNDTSLKSRKSLSKLIKIAKSDSKYKKLAEELMSSIYNELAIYKNPPGVNTDLVVAMEDGTTKHIKNVTTSKLFNALEDKMTIKHFIPALMANIEKRPKNEICIGAIKILKDSDSVIAAAATCGILLKSFGPKAEYLDFDGWIKICENELLVNVIK